MLILSLFVAFCNFHLQNQLSGAFRRKGLICIVRELKNTIFAITDMKYSRKYIRKIRGGESLAEHVLSVLLASGEISHLWSGENDQSQSDRNNQCISFSFL